MQNLEHVINELEAAAPEIDPGLQSTLLELTKQYGPEMMTAVLGFLSIYLINRGSTRYDDFKPHIDPEETKKYKLTLLEKLH